MRALIKVAVWLAAAQSPPRRSLGTMHIEYGFSNTIRFEDLFWFIPLAVVFAAGVVLTVVGRLKHRKALWIIGVVVMGAAGAAGILMVASMMYWR